MGHGAPGDIALGLETMAAQNRPALGRQKWDGGFGAALRTGRAGLGPRARGSRNPLRLARLATLGIVPELLLVEEQLLSRREHEVAATIDTFEDSIGKFHSVFPPGRRPSWDDSSASALFTRGRHCFVDSRNWTSTCRAAPGRSLWGVSSRRQPCEALRLRCAFMGNPVCSIAGMNGEPSGRNSRAENPYPGVAANIL